MAGLELALCTPFLLVFLGATIDYSQMFWGRAQLASSVAQGAEYAHLIGSTVTAANIRTVVQRPLNLPAANVTVTTPSCFCVAGLPAVATAQVCTAPCADQSLPGTYTRITATYTYVPLMPLQSLLVNTVLSETALVRLK